MASGGSSAGESQSIATSTQSVVASTQSVRLKSDPTWEHCQICYDTEGKKVLKCLYCAKIFKGGGIHRMKMHLAGQKGDALACTKVSYDVRYQLGELLKSTSASKKRALDQRGADNSSEQSDMNTHILQSQETPIIPSQAKGKGKEIINSFFAPRTTPGAQPSIKSALAGKEAIHRADLAVARFFYDCCISFNCANSIYYQPMIDAIAAIGPGYIGPSYHSIRTKLLYDIKKEVGMLVETFRSAWKETGCTIMGDGWQDQKNRQLINFLIYSPKGICFVRSVDASDVVKDAATLCNLFVDLVEFAGASNVVHLVTDNAANYKAAGRLLNEKFPSIFWSPCAAHCLNLILADIGKMEFVKSLTEKASKELCYNFSGSFQRNPRHLIDTRTVSSGGQHIASLFRVTGDLLRREMFSERDESATRMINEIPSSHRDTSTSDQGEDVHILISSRLQERSDGTMDRRHILDFIKAGSFRDWFKKLEFLSPLRVFKKTLDHREEVSLSVSTPISSEQHFSLTFLRSINWSSFLLTSKEWMKQPKNVSLLIWIVCVSISASILALLMLGVLDKMFPSKSARNQWIEITNQILNALFTLMSLYQHPNLFHQFILLCRWRSEDIRALRKIYSKNGGYRQHEWVHMMVVVLLLHVTCFAQYVSCGLYWGYLSEQRPEFAGIFFFVLGIAAPVVAGAYTVYSPLGRECDAELDEELHDPISDDATKVSCRPGFKLFKLRALVRNPKWAGGLFDCTEDVTVSCLSLFCTFCVFGWNMERLGFGNMYVHMVTFLLLCIAPFWIFNISALNIHDKVTGDILGIAGIVLCAFGLLYGGFWRIQMRKRFKLPGNDFCCGSNSLTDYLQWMFCWACSLAQEVRTGSLYEVEDDSLYRKQSDIDEAEELLHPLPREGGRNPLGKLNFDTFSVEYSGEFLTVFASQDQQNGQLHDLKLKPSEMRPPYVQTCTQDDNFN